MQLTLALIVAVLAAETAEDLTCLNPAAGEPAAATLFYAALQRQAYAALDRRQARYEQLKTPDDIAAYQQRQRAFLLEQADPTCGYCLQIYRMVEDLEHYDPAAVILGRVFAHRPGQRLPEQRGILRRHAQRRVDAQYVAVLAGAPDDDAMLAQRFLHAGRDAVRRRA